MKKHLIFLPAAWLVLFFQNAIGQDTSPFWSMAGNAAASSTSKLGTTTATPLQIYTKNVARLVIDTSGRVSIGINTAAARLHVNTSSSTPPFLLQVNGISKFMVSTDGGVAVGDGTIAPPAQGLYVPGNVGIGTTTPQKLLHVEGADLQNLFVSTSALSTTSGAGIIGYVKALPTDSGQRLGYFLTGSRGGAEKNNNVAGMSGYAASAWTSGSHPAYLAFETTPSGAIKPVERLRITQSGKVGIGTTAPIATLHVESSTTIGAYIKASQTALSAKSDLTAVYGEGGLYGVYGYGSGSIGGGVLGSGNTYGVYGESRDSAYGVYGKSSSTYNAGGSSGVYGTGYYGVQGSGSYGVKGTGTYGVKGEGTADGVLGESSSTTGSGVYGSGHNGVYGNGVATGVVAWGGDYGVTGISTKNNSKGVYGDASGTGSYAGYFNGDVWAVGNYQGSDRKLKKNIQAFESALGIIRKLQPRRYEYRQDENYQLLHLPNGTHYGLIAQEVEGVLPDIVKATSFDVRLAKQAAAGNDSARANGNTSQQPENIDFKAVNYTELISILVKAVQELDKKSTDNDALKQQVTALTQRIEKLEALLAGNVTLNSSAKLLQAIPNPASGTTRILYSLPPGTSGAQLLLTDALGRQIRTVALSNAGRVDVNTASLSSGVYYYSLYIAGKNWDSKKLVVAR